MMRQPMTKESSWAMINVAPDDDLSSNSLPKRAASQAMKNSALPTLDEEHSARTRSMEVPTEFQSPQPTRAPAGSTPKTARKEQMTRMSSWACLGMDDF